MGNFYTNFTLPGQNPEAVAAALSGRSAIVTLSANGAVVVFDEESDSQDPQAITEVGTHLSRTLGCPVLAILNHDDDILFYQLFERGAETDQYCSSPGYFSGEQSSPSGGDASKLCAAFGSANITEVQAILRPPDGELPVFALDQHAALVEALGTCEYGIGGGFEYISRGELPGDLKEEDLLRVTIH